MGILDAAARFAKAQRNAAKPRSEGGLGLRPDNTAAERADAMFPERGYISSLEDISEFDDVGKFMGHTGTGGVSVSNNRELASRYLDRFGEIRYDGVPFQKNVMPVRMDTGNTIHRDSPYPTNIMMGSPLPDGWVAPHIRDGYDTAVFEDSISRGGPVKHSNAKNAIRGKEYVTRPENIRSIFAAFDPFLRKSKDLMATGALGLLGSNLYFGDER